MENKKDLIYLVLTFIMFGVAVVFLVLSIVTKNVNSLYLIIALSATIIGNVINLIRNIRTKKMNRN